MIWLCSSTRVEQLEIHTYIQRERGLETSSKMGQFSNFQAYSKDKIIILTYLHGQNKHFKDEKQPTSSETGFWTTEIKNIEGQEKTWIKS